MVNKTYFTFLSLFFLVLAVMVVVLSYTHFKEENENRVALLQLKKELANDLNSLQKEDFYGIRTLKYSIPDNFYEMCFFDLGSAGVNESFSKPNTNEESNRNLFLIGKYDSESVYISNLHASIPPSFFCAQANEEGEVELKITKRLGVLELAVPAYKKYCENAANAGVCSMLNIAFYEDYSSNCCGDFGICC